MTRPALFAANSPAHEVATELKDLVGELDGAGRSQTATGRDASGAVVSTEALLIECEGDIRRAAKTARGLERKNIGIAALFALPKSWSWQDVANTSVAFCDNATDYAAAFERMGLDAAWWADLRADANEISVRKTTQQSDVDERIGHTAALGDLMRQGVEVLSELEPIVENALHLAHKEADLVSFERAARLDKSTSRGAVQPAKS